MDFKALLDFLSELQENNTKEWMDLHKDHYQKLRKDYIIFTQQILEGIARFDSGVAGLDPKKCIFRINRDIRFSKDKRPYKTNFGSFITEGGKNSGNAGYYLHIAPGDGSFIGGGIYMPPGAVLAKIRQEIDYNPELLKELIADPDFFSYFGEIQGERLKTTPKGYPKDHPDIGLLRLKSFTVAHPLSDKDLKGVDFLKETLAGMKLLQPFNEYLNTALS